MSDGDRVAIAEAMTDMKEGSVIEALISNGPPICPNMTDAEFRRMVLTLCDRAVQMIDVRLVDLRKWGRSNVNASQRGLAQAMKRFGSV
ncbi:hypothetical protein [Burkholderia lata]|uniref:hypothetical protein n=1 Tax=Burkholderia lata (strain ATCC 17760 / DSM 23089 / LMG 22485 / NCIMB 9086 / R18194 / 383) TaxID=482957 RepID=UPI0020C6AB15|nr:hypothetical protein [Burkholderia lata]